ncbi:unnamed protein product [Adineta ricciae]|uniref:SUEL-type lectin domain-containing protein n=2 Tax=Adineta ricciae TaxID=249248 RepID=A0A814FCS1_ADIRI|nr:unnamed protein product [Adineta ricciae]
MIFQLIVFHFLSFSPLLVIHANVETLHFESACLQQTNAVHLNLRCSQYEHIQIVRVIYGYTKQTLLQECQFSIYDCIQEGTSHNILACNGQQTCVINLTKNEMLSSSITTPGVPSCPDFNYVQVNFGCIPDSKDICDTWKDEGPVIHLSHTYSKDRAFNRCHCKVRSSMPNGQVLLQAREINRQHTLLRSLIYPKSFDLECKKMTYLEIAISRSERKCMDMLPTNNIALFGSGSHNFTLTYVRNDPFSELFFYFELKASPVKKDHNVQIICNWGRRQTKVTTTTTIAPALTTAIISTTIPRLTKKRKATTVNMQRGGKLSRLDLIRHQPQDNQNDHIEVEDTTNMYKSEEEIPSEGDTEGEGEGEESEEEPLTTTLPVLTSRIKKSKRTKISTTPKTTTIPDTTKTASVSPSSSDDEEWLRILSLANIDSQSHAKQILSINNRTYVTAAQASVITSDQKIRSPSSKPNTLVIILLIIISLTFLVLIIYCLKIKKPNCLERLRTNANVAFLFCCEASKLLFCSPNDSPQRSQTTSNSPTSTIGNRRHRRRHHRPSPSVPDYQSSEYYMDETGNNCRTTQSIYDGGGEKSIYSIDYDEEETEYTTKYGRHNNDGGSYSISQDSLTNGEQDHNKNNSNQNSPTKIERPTSAATSKVSSKMSTIKSTTNGLRSLALDEHIKLVKQKKEEAEVLRLQKFQEQLRKKEQKWQQQQLERVKKWLQLRNRDTDHRSQVEERRKKREEEAKAKIDELIRREKEREQRVHQNLKTITAPQKPDSVMSASTDVLSTRRATSASRSRTNHQDVTNRRGLHEHSDDNSATVISSHQLNPIGEHQTQSSNDESSGTSLLSARRQKRLLPTSHAYWLNTGDNHNHTSSNFMRATFTATCRSRISRSVERCPRDGRAREEVLHPSTATNGESQRRPMNTTRQHLNETIRRLAKPKSNPMTQSIHIGATTGPGSSNGIPLSRSSHQLRLTTSTTATTIRKRQPSRPATVPASTNESRTSPTIDDVPRSDQTLTHKSVSNRSAAQAKLPPSSTKTLPNSASQSHAPTQRSLMTTSHSSSSLSSSTATINKRRLAATTAVTTSATQAASSSKSKSTSESPVAATNPDENAQPVNEETPSESVEPDVTSEPINSVKREQPTVDEQEYQRKLNQKIREAQQRLELERQREEEQKRQLELEEFEREQEQIRLVEEQRRAEQERLQRAIEERERENELKRQEEQRLQQQREELERKQAEETERLTRERQERAKKEEEERNERKKRLDLIMRRTRQISPNSKQENDTNKPAVEQLNGHDQTNHTSSPTNIIKSSLPHSISDTHFHMSTSTDSFILTHDSVVSPSFTTSITDTPKFKSPLIQSLLNKARNTRSTDNLVQTSMTASQIMTESLIEESVPLGKSTTLTNLSNDDHLENSRINTNTNGHGDLHLSSSTNLNVYHDRPRETATASQ